MRRFEPYEGYDVDNGSKENLYNTDNVSMEGAAEDICEKYDRRTAEYPDERIILVRKVGEESFTKVVVTCEAVRIRTGKIIERIDK